ncbi:MAG: hypothetical protein WD021_08400, partial [Rhodothermales bacterium]
MPHLLRHVLAFACLLSIPAQAQVGGVHLSESGHPFYLEHFPPHEYGAYPQNWSVVQDVSGRIFVGNYDGILVYDGVSWDLVATPTNTTARSLAVGDDGIVYVGLQGDFGYLAPDSVGSYAYTSLANRLAQSEREFRDVWATHVVPGAVYFQAASRLIRWDGESFHVWQSEEGFHTSFEVDGEIYVREIGRGLLCVKDDDLTVVPGGDHFSDTRIYVLDDLADGSLLVGTQEKGFLVYDGSGFQSFETEADAYLANHRLYHGTVLPNGYIALGLLDGGGLIILDPNGRISAHYTEESGLPDGWINFLYRDAQGGLWLALNNRGVVRIDPLSHITKFEAESGLDGVVGDLHLYEDSLYVAGSTGLFRLNPSRLSHERARLVKVDGIHVATSLAQIHDKLVVASHDDIRVLDGTRIEFVAEGTFYSVAVSSAYPDRFYAGSKTGVALFELRDGVWNIEPDFVRINDEVRRLVEGDDGTLWIASRSNRVYRVDTFSGKSKIRDVTPSDHVINRTSLLKNIYGRTYLLGESGPVILDDGGEALSTRDREVARILSASTDSLLYLGHSPDGRLWRVYADRVEITACGLACSTNVPEVLRYPEWSGPVNVHVDSVGVAWISTRSTLLRYDPSIETEKSYDAIFPAMLRRVRTIDTNRLLYGGVWDEERDIAEPLFQDLPFSQNALRFEFAFP